MSFFGPISIEYNKISINNLCEKDSIDITSNFNSIIINESILNKLITGTISFKDGTRLFDTIDFTGNETITISLIDKINNRTFEEKEVNLIFSIISYKKESDINSTSQLVELEFVDTSYKNFIKEFSTSFNNKLISNFIKSFSKDTLEKEINIVENTDEKLSFAFPYQKFNYIFSYLNQYMISENGYKGYLYFSTLNQKTFLCTLSFLIDQSLGRQVIHNFKEVGPNQVDEDNDYFIDYSLEENFNIKNFYENKGLGSTQQRFNHSTKTLIEKQVDYDTVINNEYSLGIYSSLDKTLSDKKNSVYYASTENQKSEQLIIENNLLSSDEVILSLGGEFHRNAGDLVKITFLNRSTLVNSEDVNNKNLTGNYLIKNIIHIFQSNKYNQVLSCIRNGKNLLSNSNQIELDKIFNK